MLWDTHGTLRIKTWQKLAAFDNNGKTTTF